MKITSPSSMTARQWAILAGMILAGYYVWTHRH